MPLQEIINFVVIYVIGRQIVAPRLADFIMKYLTDTSKRNFAIFRHYQHRAAGEGHFSDSVLDCADRDCSVFRTA